MTLATPQFVKSSDFLTFGKMAFCLGLALFVRKIALLRSEISFAVPLVRI